MPFDKNRGVVGAPQFSLSNAISLLLCVNSNEKFIESSHWGCSNK